MPIYEYKCGACQKDFEFLVMNSEEKVECEACGSAKVEKKFSTFGVGGSHEMSRSEMPCGMGAPDPGSCPPMGCGMSQCDMN